MVKAIESECPGRLGTYQVCVPDGGDPGDTLCLDENGNLVWTPGACGVDDSHTPGINPGDMWYYNPADDQLYLVPIGTAGQVLSIGASGIPEWVDPPTVSRNIHRADLVMGAASEGHIAGVDADLIDDGTTGGNAAVSYINTNYSDLKGVRIDFLPGEYGGSYSGYNRTTHISGAGDRTHLTGTVLTSFYGPTDTAPLGGSISDMRITQTGISQPIALQNRGSRVTNVDLLNGYIAGLSGPWALVEESTVDNAAYAVRGYPYDQSYSTYRNNVFTNITDRGFFFGSADGLKLDDNEVEVLTSGDPGAPSIFLLYATGIVPVGTVISNNRIEADYSSGTYGPFVGNNFDSVAAGVISPSSYLAYYSPVAGNSFSLANAGNTYLENYHASIFGNTILTPSAGTSGSVGVAVGNANAGAITGTVVADNT